MKMEINAVLVAQGTGKAFPAFHMPAGTGAAFKIDQHMNRKTGSICGHGGKSSNMKRHMNHRSLFLLLALFFLSLPAGAAEPLSVKGAAEPLAAKGMAEAPSPSLAALPPSPSLIDRLLSVIGNKDLPRINIPPPTETAPPSGKSLPPPHGAASRPVAPPRAGALEIARAFIPVYALGREPDEHPSVLPFFASAPVAVSHPGIRTLVIMLHDTDREAARAYAFARSAQDEAAARMPETDASSTFLFAPQFLSPEDIASHKEEWPDGGDAILRWVGDSWVYGGDSVPAMAPDSWIQKKGINSFDVMDFILLMLARPSVFPDLQRIVIAGTAAGADFVQRYAMLGISPNVLAGEGIEIRYAIGNARSFLYPDKYRARFDDGENKELADFSFTEAKPELCPSINAYPYGLDKLPPYASRQGVGDVRMRYSARSVYYLAGDGATLPIQETTPEACALNAQGANIRERTRAAFALMQRLYAHELDRTQKLYLLPRLNEDGLALWRSTCGMSVLFGTGICNPQESGGKAMKVLQ
jgi:hypothetical protein